MKTPLLIVLALAFMPPPPPVGAPPPPAPSPPPAQPSAPALRPAQVIRLALPELPPTLFAMVRGNTVPEPAVSLRLPDNYTPEGSFPLLAYLGPGDGGVGADISAPIDIVGKSDYIVAAFPLFRRSYDPDVKWDFGAGADDWPVMGPAYAAIMQRLRATVPNIDASRSILGGYSNGAQAIAALLSVLDETIVSSFAGFFLVDSGFDWSGYKRIGVLGKHHILYLVGEGDDDREWWRDDLVNRIRYFEKCAKFMGVTRWRFEIMPGVGHRFPDEYDAIIRAWAKDVREAPVP